MQVVHCSCANGWYHSGGSCAKGVCQEMGHMPSWDKGGVPREFAKGWSLYQMKLQRDVCLAKRDCQGMCVLPKVFAKGWVPCQGRLPRDVSRGLAKGWVKGDCQGMGQGRLPRDGRLTRPRETAKGWIVPREVCKESLANASWVKQWGPRLPVSHARPINLGPMQIMLDLSNLTRQPCLPNLAFTCTTLPTLPCLHMQNNTFDMADLGHLEYLQRKRHLEHKLECNSEAAGFCQGHHWVGSAILLGK